MKHIARLTIQAKFKLTILFYFSVAIGSEGIPASVWREEGDFEVIQRLYIQIYPASFSLRYGKAVNLHYM